MLAVCFFFYLAKLKGEFFGENPNRDFRIQRGFCLFLSNPKTDQDGWIPRIKSKSAFLRFTNWAFILGKDLKTVFLTSDFPNKNDRRRTCMTLKLNQCWWRHFSLENIISARSTRRWRCHGNDPFFGSSISSVVKSP